LSRVEKGLASIIDHSGDDLPS